MSESTDQEETTPEDQSAGVPAGESPSEVAPEGQDTPAQQADSFQPGELAGANGGLKADVDINIILDVDVDLALEVGRTTMTVRNLLQLNQGSIIELDRSADEPLDVLVNGTLVARGEVVVVNESFGVRLTEIVTPLERIGKLK